MTQITIKSYKYPNVPYIEYSGELLEETSHYWFVKCPENNILKHHIKNKELTYKEASLHFFSKYHGYTVSIAINEQMAPISMFCNISTPCTFKDGHITYTDIDIDYVKSSDGQWFIKNSDTYIENSRQFHYPIQLTNFAVVSLQELKNNIADGIFPFDVSNFSSIEKYSAHKK
ncbi:DUF402 domain-containing protein [Macrococcus hajekii]|uniref:DUF402 domain-containing protein n=1 Tax=Macrococcus hajekii TaxID=198482 RepID=A0A4R6BJH1_9STAP|nr:DUF402 domain-containing protein [Macrococcus hajekii]TDM01691.1 DUF402 domain-containing protein [Macrococcus hajekii]GGB06615.1 hypothetical protein GCM10007190_13340 [Macrococcus hajekii]